MAVGLGSMDMPIPQVAAWEWVNWKFPKAVHAGESIYARWTLTQKRPPVHGSATGIAVWRVDVMTADGAICAEGEVGATVFRRAGAHAEKPAAEVASGRPRRRRRRGSGQAEAAAPAAPAAPAASPAAAERPAGGAGTSRRRRRKRGGGSSGNGNGGGEHAGNTSSTVGAAPPEAPPAAPPVVPTPAVPAESRPPKGRLSEVMRRLRRT